MSKTLAVLIVEDSESDLLLIIRELKKGGYSPVYERVETASAMKKALKDKQWDIILCDYKMPEFNAPSAIALLNETNIDIPLIIVSGTIGEETAVECMRSGAHDYLMKDNLSRLCPAIARELEEAETRRKRKRAEEAMRESEERYRALFDRSLDLVYLYGFEGRFLDANDAALNRLGYTREEIPSLNFASLLSEDQLPLAFKTLQEIQKTGNQKKLVEFKLRHKNGSEVYIETIGSIIISNGTPIAIQSIARDITERKKTEKALLESEENFRRSIDDSPLGIRIVTAEGETLYANRAILDIYGYDSIEELRGTPLKKRYTLESYDDFKKRKERREQTESDSTEYEISIVRKNGEVRHVHVFRKEIVWNGAKQFQVTYHDITERKGMENQLREQLAEINNLKIRLQQENVYLRKEIETELGLVNIIGGSDALRHVLLMAQQGASTDVTVLILGQTGTGKGMVAHAIHEMSTRKEKPMVTINCTAIPENLFESELFGREKGAFTGAHTRQIGRFEVADGGTIFMDEIGDMPLALQAKLLRVLQDGEFERLGSNKTVKVDVRVIAATSRDLKNDVSTGRFREDLFYRLNVFPVSIPPLSMRIEDIPLLVNYFVDKYSRKYGRQIEIVSKSTMQKLQDYHWPGNVRELEHLIERAIIISPGSELIILDNLGHEAADKGEDSLKDLETTEREHILKVLQKTKWKVQGKGGAATILGVNPSTLRFRIKKLGITHH
jgi:PAS domain S-box-containing protein